MQMQQRRAKCPPMARLMPTFKPHTLDAHTALNARCMCVPLIKKLEESLKAFAT
jgi:hypothetical protein